jgi:hypothetical protein
MRATRRPEVEPSPSAPIVIRPTGVGEVLDAGLRLARRNYSLLVLLSAWGAVPLFVVSAFFALIGGGTQQQLASAVISNPALILVFVVLFLVSALLFGLSYMAVMLACSRLITGNGAPDDLRAGTLYRLALGRLGAYILLALLFALLYVPLVILFPLGIFLVVRWSVSPVALAIERSGPIASLGRSWDLTRGSWWHTLGTIVVWFILLIVLEGVASGISGVIVGILAVSGSLVVANLLTSIISLLVGLLVTPISLAIYVVLYYELRARREGFDLAMRAQHVPGT